MSVRKNPGPRRSTPQVLSWKIRWPSSSFCVTWLRRGQCSELPHDPRTVAQSVLGHLQVSRDVRPTVGGECWTEQSLPDCGCPSAKRRRAGRGRRGQGSWRIWPKCYFSGIVSSEASKGKLLGNVSRSDILSDLLNTQD